MKERKTMNLPGSWPFEERATGLEPATPSFGLRVGAMVRARSLHETWIL